MKWIATLMLVAMPATIAAQRERLEITERDGTLVAAIDGDQSRVSIDPAADDLLRQPDRHLTLTHNHPNSVGLSGADLSQLLKPGVDRIVAIGTDGSRYEAARGPRFDARHFMLGQYEVAEASVRAGVAHVYRRRGMPVPVERLAPHLTALALQRAGVLRYHAGLAHDQLQTQGIYYPEIADVTAAAAVRVMHEARDRMRTPTSEALLPDPSKP